MSSESLLLPSLSPITLPLPSTFNSSVSTAQDTRKTPSFQYTRTPPCGCQPSLGGPCPPDIRPPAPAGRPSPSVLCTLRICLSWHFHGGMAPACPPSCLWVAVHESLLERGRRFPLCIPVPVAVPVAWTCSGAMSFGAYLLCKDSAWAAAAEASRPGSTVGKLERWERLLVQF